jgi:NAD(P)-dependent dehydrogenase (short-subunit alcohol dehydrogenase family)
MPHAAEDRDRLDGRRVVVAGGAGGIGSAVAAALAAQGADVIIADRTRAAGEALAAELGAAFLPLDLEDLPGAITSVQALPGPVDGLVNAAGSAEAPCADLAGELDEWLRLLRVNLLAPVFLARALAGRMPARASVVNITSIAAERVLALSGAVTPAYGASKAALQHATQALAVEWGARGIRVNAVAPGFVRTAMTDRYVDEYGDRITATTPIGRLATASEIADAVLFLLSDRSAFITGQTIVVDGGIGLALSGPTA